MLERLSEAWQRDRARVEESGDKVIEQLREYASLSPGTTTPGREVLDRAFQSFRRVFDSQLGGFGRAPKFPRPSIHNFLVRYYAETGHEEALEMVLTTLREMVKGGMNDQIGGGFHRYSVDERWFVPHFEKMLYDQAQLAVSYLEAFQITRDGQYAAAARDIFTYLLRDMTDPGGGFYSAEDADSASDPAHPHEKGEGAFYIWRKQEIDDALEPGRCRDVLLSLRRRTQRQCRGGSAGRISRRATSSIRRTLSKTPPLTSELPLMRFARNYSERRPNCSRSAPAVRGPCATTRFWRPGTA